MDLGEKRTEVTICFTAKGAKDLTLYDTPLTKHLTLREWVLGCIVLAFIGGRGSFFWVMGVWGLHWCFFLFCFSEGERFVTVQ
jgi:hypothetical protein